MPFANIAVTIETDAAWLFPFSRFELRNVVAAMLEEAGRSGTAVEVIVTGDAAMEALHLSAMGCPGPTNILSFPAGNPGLAAFTEPSDASAPGHMVFSAATLARECLLYGQEPEQHALRLLAHGLAHVLGFEHGGEMDRFAERLECAAAGSPA